MSDPLVVLPMDISILIFGNMALHEIARCMLVSKKWYYSLDRWSVLWKNIEMSDIAPSNSLAASRTDLGFRLANRTSTRDISDHSDIFKSRLLYDQNLKTLARRAGPALSRLSLPFSPLITDVGLATLIHFGCVNIRVLELRANRHITNGMLETLIDRIGSRLEHVALSTTEISDFVVQRLLVSAPNLTRLDLSFCRFITVDAFPVAETSEFVFSFTQNPGVPIGDEDGSLSALNDGRDWHRMFSVDKQSLPKLKVLLLSGCKKITDSAIRRIFYAFAHSLCVLDICHTKASFMALHSIATEHRRPLKLQALMMNSIPGHDENNEELMDITNGGFGLPLDVVDNLATRIPDLMQLCLGGGISLVSDDLLVGILRHCRGLLFIDVHDALRVGDRTLFALSENCTGVRSVNLSGCLSCSDAGVIQLVRNCTFITHLDLSAIDISDDSLAAIGDHQLHLKSLLLDFCRRITTNGIKVVVEGTTGLGCMFTLTELSFIQCRRVSDEAVGWCKERMLPDAVVSFKFNYR
ncbi:hypothetical protein LPJ66_000095 [Kickxella alabastrina]|uniref:Uncharacterized protein n=1 Tax=Kickxella alabastrina TaxID=61397 RepID=A0ACC1IX09_9FUNG|nr:hypothetical protein LPJ66_000095 [Kickxella alabastrina]